MIINTEILIASPASRVWQELTRFEEHPDWNPFIKSLQGKLAVGERLKVHICPPGEKGMVFKPRVLRVKPEQEFAWLGHLLIPGIFDGEHYFRLEAISENQTRLIHGERFSGILVPLFKGMLAKTKLGFEHMNLALKARCES